jgi:hypothetical protein
VLELTPNAARLKLSRARRHMRGLLGPDPPGLLPDTEAGHAF